MENRPAPAEETPRRARPDEAGAVADLWLASRRASVPQIPPVVHTDVEVRSWFCDVVLPTLEVWVIGPSDDLVALMVLAPGWIDQLYVRPHCTGRGLGAQLVDLAKHECSSLDLWTFQTNLGARRFYERQGFVAVATTDGDNEEGAPAVRYHWSLP